MKPYEFVNIFLFGVIFGISTATNARGIMFLSGAGIIIGGIRAIYYAMK
ncbi:hypothetical protein EC99P2_00043 [Enterococcus phage EC99P2]|nr:hypothetical protein EC99P2_00043 [Enterococcus phage EC99P2]